MTPEARAMTQFGGSRRNPQWTHWTLLTSLRTLHLYQLFGKITPAHNPNSEARAMTPEARAMTPRLVR